MEQDENKDDQNEESMFSWKRIFKEEEPSYLIKEDENEDIGATPTEKIKRRTFKINPIQAD